MQNRINHYYRTTQEHQTHWYRSQWLAISIFVLAIFNWAISSAIIAGEIEYRPSVLIIKGDGCRHLRQFGIPTTPYSIESTCTVAATFRQHLIGNGGVIDHDDRRIKIADDLIVAVETMTDSPLTPSQYLLLFWFAFNTVFAVSVARWVGVAFKTGVK